MIHRLQAACVKSDKEEESKKSEALSDQLREDPEYLEHFRRLIIHLDMDAYYAQVEMKQHNIDIDVSGFLITLFLRNLLPCSSGTQSSHSTMSPRSQG